MFIRWDNQIILSARSARSVGVAAGIMAFAGRVRYCRFGTDGSSVGAQRRAHF